MNKTIKVSCILIIILLVVLFCFTGVRVYKVHKTEKNVSVIVASIFKLNFQKVIQLNETSYLTKANSKHMIEFLEDDKWKFVEQLGAAYVFKNPDGETVFIMTRYVFSANYLIWEIRD